MPDHPEHRLSHYVDTLLDRIVLEPCWFSAVDTGTVMVNSTPTARMRWEQRRRAMGIKPHHLDWYVYQAPLFGQIELKFGSNKPSAGQQDTMAALARQNIAHGCAWSVLDVYRWLRDSGYRLHANAENIAHEIEARWRAAQDGAERKKPARRTSRARTAKPSRAALAAAARGNDLWGRTP